MWCPQCNQDDARHELIPWRGFPSATSARVSFGFSAPGERGLLHDLHDQTLGLELPLSALGGTFTQWTHSGHHIPTL